MRDSRRSAAAFGSGVIRLLRRATGTTTMRALFATGLLALSGGAQAALIELELDATIGSGNFFESSGVQFFQIGRNLTFSPYGPVALSDGDTARVTFNFADGQAVRVTDEAASPIEVAVGFLTAGQLVNPGPTQIDVTFDFTLTFLGASGDLALPSIFRPNVRNIGGGFGPSLAADLTGSSFLFQGVAMEFANIRDNNAAAGVTEANRLLPRNFDVASFRIQSRGGVAQAQAVAVPEPSTFGLLAMGVIGLGWSLGRRLHQAIRTPGASNLPGLACYRAGSKSSIGLPSGSSTWT